MTLVDTSAWVAFLRADGSAADRALTRLLEEEAALWTTATVVAELLAGADDEEAAERLEDILGSVERCAPPDPADLRVAARLFRDVRAGGEGRVSLSACLIAAVALRDGLSLLSTDPAFRVLARHGGPHVRPPDAPHAGGDVQVAREAASEAIPRSPEDTATILVVEDEPSAARMLQDALTRPERRIVTATTAKEARLRIADSAPDLIVLDLILPDEDGRRLLADLRRNAETSGIAVVVVTGRAGPLTREECFGLGADEFFAKPFDATALGHSVERLLTDGRPDTPGPDLLGHPYTLSEVQKLLNGRRAAEDVTTPWTVALLEIDTNPRGNGSPAEGPSAGPVESTPLLPRLLRTVIGTLSQELDQGDLIARWGVDEVVVVSQDKDDEEMSHLVRRLAELPEVAPYLESQVRRVGRDEDLLDTVSAMAGQLTRARPSAPTSQTTTEPVEAPRAPRLAPRRPRPKATLVEDDPVTAALVRHRLERSGFHVDHHDDGAEALEAILADPPDVVVLDVQLPSMDGFEILGRVREDEGAQRVPVLMFTSLGRQEHVQRGFELGADDYVTKPFSPTELLTRVLRLVRRR